MVESRTLVVVALLLIVALVARRWVPAGGVAAPIRTRYILALLGGLFAVVLTAWVWGGLNAPPVVDDEAAYVLQADLFAHGRWKRASPEPYASFTQPAVLVTPVLAPKMAPGHALLLAPGVAMGWPGAVPLLLTGVTAALLILLVSEVQSSGVAILTLVIWLTAAGQMRWRASYFSEITTGMLWLLGWWCLLRWRQTHRAHWLVLLAAATGWGAITRPLTMLAFAIPVGVIVLRDVIRGGHWRQLGGAVVVGTLCLAILPLQNYEVLGNWRRSPLALYTRQYMPFDVIGFGLDSTLPSIGLPANLQKGQLPFMARHREHRPGALPRILMTRLGMLGSTAFLGWRVLWVPAAIIGLFLIDATGWFVVGSGLLLYLAYLAYAHEPHWTVYYLEASPIPAFVSAVGLGWLLQRAAGSRTPLPLRIGLLAALAILIVATPDLKYAHIFRAQAQDPARSLVRAVMAASHTPALVFVPSEPGDDPDAHLLRNVADPATEPIVTAYDRGAIENQRVVNAFPGRRVLFLTRGPSQ